MNDKSSLFDTLIENGLIPWDKSWIIRVGILDLLRGYRDIYKFLDAEREHLSDDLIALRVALIAWENGDSEIDVGESATLYRFLRFISWFLGQERTFVRRGTLLRRQISDDPAIIDYSPRELLRLDGGTSQWASAAYLCRFGFLGRAERIDDPPEKLRLTYDAVEHWEERRKTGECWKARRDETIARQAIAIIEMVKTGQTSWRPRHSEDYCLARALGLITREVGQERFPSVRGHETDRFEEMESVVSAVGSSKAIESRDHRAIQAGVALQIKDGGAVYVIHPESVAKSWPEFWRFVEFVRK